MVDKEEVSALLPPYRRPPTVASHCRYHRTARTTFTAGYIWSLTSPPRSAGPSQPQPWARSVCDIRQKTSLAKPRTYVQIGRIYLSKFNYQTLTDKRSLYLSQWIVLPAFRGLPVPAPAPTVPSLTLCTGPSLSFSRGRAAGVQPAVQCGLRPGAAEPPPPAPGTPPPSANQWPPLIVADQSEDGETVTCCRRGLAPSRSR